MVANVQPLRHLRPGRRAVRDEQVARLSVLAGRQADLLDLHNPEHLVVGPVERPGIEAEPARAVVGRHATITTWWVVPVRHRWASSETPDLQIRRPGSVAGSGIPK